MPYATTDDNIRLFYEETGSGTPLLFIHEFAGDHRSWEPQVRHFAASYRCIVYDARGYPASDAPSDLDAYSMQRAVDDAIAVLDATSVKQAHVIGISMGGFTALHLGLRHPERLLSLTAAACGYGAQPEVEAGFRRECEAIAKAIREEGPAKFAARYAIGPARVQFQNKDRATWEVFAAQLAEHPQEGSALTMLGVQSKRPSLYALREELAAVETPTLIIAGDEDEGCLEPDLMLKRTMPAAGLALLPRTGHTANLEEPALFNELVERFITEVDSGKWAPRDPRSMVASITGMD